MSTKYYSKLLFLLFVVGVCGCKKFVSVSLPSTQLVSASTFNNDAGATAAQTAIYSQMESLNDPFLMSLKCGLLADELTNYSSDPVQQEYYRNSLQAKDIASPWQNAYKYIYDANAVINGLQTYTGVSAGAKQQLTGEAEFIRAFWYFYLVNLYGDVPLTTTIDYSVNATAARMPAGEVFAQIVADLANAEGLLSYNFVDVTDTAMTSERTRPTKWAAAALLARTYLYLSKYDSAEAQSTLVINNSNNLFQLCGTLDSVFLMNNSEAIWQIPPVQPASNIATPEGRFFILTKAPGGGSDNNNATISTQLRNAFDSGDLRKTHWIKGYTKGSVTYYFPYKYKVYSTTALSEYSTLLRLAEQYLIRAEARAQQGNSSGAITDLNVIRNRAGLSVYGGATDQASVLNAIHHERQVELFAEMGHRWFDLGRSGTINSVMSVVTPLKGGGSWNVTDVLWPIPLTEITNDPNLIQNNGY